MLLRRTIVSLAGVAAALFLIVSLATTGAQEGGNAGSGLQVSPTRSEVTGSKGEQKSFSITLKNITKADLTAKAILNDFESDNVSGTPRIIVDEKQRTPYTLANMIQGLQDVELKAGETKELKFTLDVPGNASPGAYFGAIRYQAVPKSGPAGDRQVALNASVAHLAFLEIPGEVNEQIQVQSLQAQRGGKSGSLFVRSPEKLALGVKNLGNGFSRPFGKVNLNYFGKEVHNYEVNNTQPRGIILPNSSRIFTDDIKNIKKPGKYNAVASVAYGNGGEVVTYKSSFWYLPLWFIVIFALLLLAVAAGAFTVYRKRFASSRGRRR